MNKKLNFLFMTLFVNAFLCTSSSYALTVISGTKEMPLEINLLIDNLSNNPDNYNKMLPMLLDIDLSARAMSKEDIFVIGKIEVYKTLLKNYDTPIKQPVDGASLTTLRTAIPKVKDNFIKWFLQALLKDAEDLTKNSKYKEFLLQKNNDIKVEKVEYRKLEKKGELLQYWISKISPEAQDFPDTLVTTLTPKMFDALKNIQNSFHMMAQESSLSTIGQPLKDESEFKFFTVKKSIMKPTIPLAPEQKSVEDILAPVLETPSAQDLPEPSQENWLEDENAPATLQNLPKPSNDAEWLQDF